MTDADDAMETPTRVTMSKRMEANAAHALGRLVELDRSVLEARDALGRTPLYEAVETDRPEVVRSLTMLGANIFELQGPLCAASTPWAAALAQRSATMVRVMLTSPRLDAAAQRKCADDLWGLGLQWSEARGLYEMACTTFHISPRACSVATPAPLRPPKPRM